jgi:hypothetical protein
MERTLAVLNGATPAQAIREFAGKLPRAGEVSRSEIGGGGVGAQTTQPVGGAAAKTTYYTPPPESSASGALLNYLLGD